MTLLHQALCQLLRRKHKLLLLQLMLFGYCCLHIHFSLIGKIDFLRHICDILFQMDQLQVEHNSELYIGMKVLNVHCNLPQVKHNSIQSILTKLECRLGLLVLISEMLCLHFHSLEKHQHHVLYIL